MEKYSKVRSCISIQVLVMLILGMQFVWIVERLWLTGGRPSHLELGYVTFNEFFVHWP